MAAEQVRTLIGTTIWNEYFKFCFERNPWDRAVSQHFWRTRQSEPRPSLLEFLRSQYVKGPPDFGGLSNFGIYSIDGDIAVDRVGLYENLYIELERIAVLLNLPEEIKVAGCAISSFRSKRPPCGAVYSASTYKFHRVLSTALCILR